MEHGYAQLGYLMWKMNAMDELFKPGKQLRERKWERGHTFAVETMSFPLIYDLWCKLYPHGRKTITPAILDEVTPEAFAVWFCDDGCNMPVSSRHALALALGGISNAEISLVREWIHGKGFTSNLHVKKHNCVLLYFPVAVSEKLAAWFGKFVPSCMDYKLASV